MEVNPKSLGAIKSILEEFSLFRSLEINTTNITTTFSKVCEESPELQDILGFQSKNLHITYLGIPITRKKKSFNQCWKMETNPSFRKTPSYVEWKCLSYGGSIQLVNWIIADKYSCSAQGLPLSGSITNKMRKLAYRFIWDGRKSITWSQIILL